MIISEGRENRREQRKVFRKQWRDEVSNKMRTNFEEVRPYITVEGMKRLALNFVQSTDKLPFLEKIKIGTTFGDLHREAILSDKQTLDFLVYEFQSDDSECHYEAAGCLTNLTGGSHEQCQKIAEAAGSYFTTYMLGPDQYLQDECAWAVANIANDCKECFSALKEHGVLTALIALLSSPHPEVVESAMYAIYACTKYEDPDAESSVSMELYSSLIKVLKQKGVTHSALVYGMFSLWNICHKIILSSPESVCYEIYEVTLTHFRSAVTGEAFDMRLATPCIRCLGILTVVSDHFCMVLAGHTEFEPWVTKVMNCQYSHIKKEFLWILCNIYVSVPLPAISISWENTVKWAKTFISPVDDTKTVLLALNLLCTMMTKSEESKSFIHNNVSNQVKLLLNCGKTDLKIAARAYFSLVENLPVAM